MSVDGSRVFVSSSFGARLFVTTAIALVALDGSRMPMRAQAPAPSPAAVADATTAKDIFDVVSIRRNKEAEDEVRGIPPYVPLTPARAQTLPGGILRGRGMTVRELIRDAYGHRNRARSEMIGLPPWADEERYNVEARSSLQFPASTSLGLPPAGETALRALLADRLKLKVRVETQRRPIFELVLRRADGRLGPNLVPSKGGCRPFFQREAVNAGLVILDPADGQPQPLRPCPLGVGSTGITAENMTMTDWVRILSMRPQLNRTVVDRTGLMGGFDITLTYIDLNDPAALRDFTSNPLPAIKPLLEGQLGLTLREAEGPVEVLVVENVERPSEN
jgi:uncharacterized protein (TIGR03435 family)